MLRHFLASTAILVTALVLLVGVAMLAGCTTAKYVECIARDATSRPCN